ncbi:MAG TPA: flagellar export chaperone FliS [Candidatus Polarisedimenticolia bacterium]|nr:flagellar export chaperone FliS [Candidatus Polarisedimenticolia bacterium]
MERNPSQAYLEQEILTADKMGLVVRVFDIGLQQVARARAALSTRDLAAKGTAVRQASRCLALLQSTLNMKEGGEVAVNLDRLYTYLLRRLTEGHLRNDDEAFAEIAAHLSELGAAWREAASRGAADPPQASGGADASARR